jgi:hypothetical protein
VPESGKSYGPSGGRSSRGSERREAAEGVTAIRVAGLLDAGFSPPSSLLDRVMVLVGSSAACEFLTHTRASSSSSVEFFYTGLSCDGRISLHNKVSANC